MAAITAPNSAAGTTTGLLRNRTFLAMLAGQTVSVIGDGFHSVALGLWVLQTTGSAAAMATMMSVKVIIGILLGSVGGTVADRVDRRTLLIAMNAARFVLVGAIAYLVASPGASLLPIVILTGIIAVCSNFSGPAVSASLVNIVGKDELQRASGLLQMSGTLAQVMGPLLGGSLVLITGGWAALVVDALTFLFAATMYVLGGSFPSPRRDGPGRKSLLGDLKEGFAYIRTQPLIRGLVLSAPPINFFASAVMLMLPVIAVKVWQANSVAYGSIQALFPLGYALGAGLVMGFAKKLKRRGLWIAAGVSLTGLFMALVPLAPSPAVAMPLIFLLGLVNSVGNILLMTTFQAEVPSEVQGRVFGTLGSLCGIANPLAMMTAGVLADHISPVLIASSAGVASLLLGVLLVGGSRTLRQYH